MELFTSSNTSTILMKELKFKSNFNNELDCQLSVISSLIEKYKEEWKNAKKNSKRLTKGGYEKVSLKELGKMEAFAMIIDDLASIQR